jgi:GntR family transcriptional regulator, rspAB operon transcriptional repressor
MSSGTIGKRAQSAPAGIGRRWPHATGEDAMPPSPADGRKSQPLGRNQDTDAGPGIGLPFGAPKLSSDGEVKTSLVQTVYEAVMAALDEGRLTPGSRIIASELAAQLGLSRAPVREALHVLAGQGLVELLPDRGAVLRPMTRDDLAEIYEVITPVAAVGLRGAAQRIHQGDNARRVSDAMAAIRRAGASEPDFRFYLHLNEFHYLVNAIAEKPYVDFILRAINIEYWNRLLAREIDLAKHVPRYVRNYEGMTQAILDGDPALAEAAIMAHARWCISLLEAPKST